MSGCRWMRRGVDQRHVCACGANCVGDSGMCPIVTIAAGFLLACFVCKSRQPRLEICHPCSVCAVCDCGCGERGGQLSECEWNVCPTAHSCSILPPPPLCDIPLGRCLFTRPWTVTRSSLRMLRRVTVFCRPLQPVFLLVSFLRQRSPAVGVHGSRWLLRGWGPCWRTSLRAVQASELGTRERPPPGWSCAVTTNGLDAVSHKRA